MNGPIAKPDHPVVETLYLHIGTEKTGSTTLQAVGGINRAKLMNHGIFYPKTPGDRNQIRLTLFAADAANAVDLRRITRLFADDDYEEFKAHFAEKLRAEIVASLCSRVFLSNEHLSSRLLSIREVTRLADVIRPLAKTVKIVVYLREQPEMFLSTYSTWIKAGRAEELEPPRTDADPRYNYSKMLSPWADVFGEENIVVRVYDRRTLVGGDVVRDFFSIMDHAPGPDIEIPVDLNTRLDHDTVQFLREFNKYVPHFLEKTLNPDRGDIVKALETISAGVPLTLPVPVLRNIVETFAASNAAVARRFLGRPDGRLFAEVNYADRPQGQPLSVTRAVEIAGQLWTAMQRDLRDMKHETAQVAAKLTSIEKIAQGRNGLSQSVAPDSHKNSDNYWKQMLTGSNA